jgi:hypothetical protein
MDFHSAFLQKLVSVDFIINLVLRCFVFPLNFSLHSLHSNYLLSEYRFKYLDSSHLLFQSHKSINIPFQARFWVEELVHDLWVSLCSTGWGQRQIQSLGHRNSFGWTSWLEISWASSGSLTGGKGT